MRTARRRFAADGAIAATLEDIRRDADVSVGDVVTLRWGEEGGGTSKTTVERHQQLEVRVKVAPVPYARDAREGYKAGWRTRQQMV